MTTNNGKYDFPSFGLGGPGRQWGWIYHFAYVYLKGRFCEIGDRGPFILIEKYSKATGDSFQNKTCRSPNHRNYRSITATDSRGDCVTVLLVVAVTTAPNKESVRLVDERRGGLVSDKNHVFRKVFFNVKYFSLSYVNWVVAILAQAH